MFNTSVPTYNIEPGRFIRLEQCLNYYRFNHSNHKCTRTQMLSLWWQSHFFAKCKECIKCCKCDVSHVTVSRSCPTRKEGLKAKWTQLRENKNSFFVRPQQPLHYPLHYPALLSRHVFCVQWDYTENGYYNGDKNNEASLIWKWKQVLYNYVKTMYR